MKKSKKFIAIVISVVLLLSVAMIAAACNKDEEPVATGPVYESISGLDTSKSVTLNIAIPYEADKGLNEVANAFTSRYPNVKVKFTHLQNYDASAKTRIIDNTIDLILAKDMLYSDAYTTVNEVAKTTDDYLYNFAADTEINFDYTTNDVMGNYRHTKDDETEYMYCVPMGGELRGVFVNVSLLNQYNLSVPTNYEEFEACCATLKSNGLIPIQGNPSTVKNNLGLAEIVNTIMNSAEGTAALQSAVGVEDYCEDALQKLYDLTANGYYEYKTIENAGGSMNGSEDGEARHFLGLYSNTETSTWSTLESTDDNYKYTQCAFWPYLSSSATYVDSLIEEYDLDFEYKFILSPMNDEGENSKAYFTPYYGLVANKNSTDLVWIREFVNFFFFEENNKIYATNNDLIPNTTDAVDYIANQYGINKDTDVTLCGEILFRDGEYNAYKPIVNGAEAFMKINPQKYMVVLNKDAAGNVVYYTQDADGSAAEEFLLLSNDDGTENTKVGSDGKYSNKVFREDVGAEYVSGYAVRSFDYCMKQFVKAFSSYVVAAEE